MNRKQKVAGVVGVVVIVLLVLFPPWQTEMDENLTGGGWRCAHGPSWIGCAPEHPLSSLADTGIWEGGEFYPVVIDWTGLLQNTIAAFALTVAAVIVLKPGEAGGDA